MGGLKLEGCVERESPDTSLEGGIGKAGQGLGMGMPGACPDHSVLTACSQAGCSLSYADHCCGPTCSRHPQGVCWPPAPAGAELQGETAGRFVGAGGVGGEGLSPSMGLEVGDSHDIFTCRLWQSRFHCWCRASEEAKLSLTAPVPS